MAEPTRPDVVLRIAVAGNRELECEPGLSSRVREIFAVTEAALLALKRGVANEAVTKDYYSRSRPTIRLISGLADGADQVVAEAFLAERPSNIDRCIAAVLPVDVATYRNRSRIHKTERFERLVAECRYVLELDGYVGDSDVPAERASDMARAASYRAQAEVLLRHADVLLAIENPEATAKAGGTRETINRAIFLGIPVLYVSLTGQGLSVLRSFDDLDRRVNSQGWPEEIRATISMLLADPRTAQPSSKTPDAVKDELCDRHEYEDEVLEEYFSAMEPRPRFRPRLWSLFENWFKRGPAPPSEDIPGPFHNWRVRARMLGSYYLGLYRGTVILTYSLAVLAVCLAVGSLTVLILFPPAHGTGDPAWWILGVFGLGKLSVVLAIQRLTSQANRSRWNERAIDYRYLAERLRSMAYLPRAGSLRALRPGGSGPASHIRIQSVMDWLFQAMVRQVSLEEVIPPTGGNRIQADPAMAATAIRDSWIANQMLYHARNADAMRRMNERLEKAGRFMSLAVIYVVAIDLGILFVGALHLLPTAFTEGFHYLAPWLLFLAAVLPAAVASVNGVRFQTECGRLADRSAQMERMFAVLKSRADATIGKLSVADGAGHTTNALTLAEDCAQITLDEVAEWTFVYTKEVAEP